MMETQPKILNDLYPDWLINGFFKQLEAYNPPWKDEVPGNVLDMDYHGNRSGEKIISSLLEKLIEDDVLSSERKLQVAQLVWLKYGQNWTRMYNAMKEEYNPLDNYNRRKTEIMDETLKVDNERVIDKVIDDTGTSSLSRTGTQSTQDTTETHDETGNNYNSNTQNDIYGFDSENASNADKSTTTQNNQSTSDSNTTGNTVVTDDKNELTTRNLKTEDNTTDIEDNTQKKDYTLTISDVGNIGVTTSQQMLESELELRSKYNIFDIIFKDVDKILTAQIFRKKETC